MKLNLNPMKKLLACLLILAMLPVTALAASYKATVNVSKMKVYSTNKVGNNYYLGYLKRGVEFTVTSTSGDWGKISYQGRTGYAKLSDMKEVLVKMSSANYKAEVTSSKMKVYSTTRVSDDNYLGYLKKGVQFTVTATGSDWAKVSYQGRTGYAKLSNFKKVTQESMTTTKYTAVVTTDKMKVYSTTSATTANYLGYLKKGVTFTVTATSSNWARISHDGKTGYAKLADFKKSTGEVTQTKTLMYSNRETKIYTSATSSSRSVCTITADLPMYVIGTSGSYYKVQTKDGSSTGYIRQSHVSKEKVNALAVADKYKTKYSSGKSTTTMPTRVKSTQDYVATNMSKSKYIEYIIYAAQSRLGCDYASSPNNKTTFKNATFVRYCFGLLDYNLDSTVKKIGHSGNAEFVTRKQLKRGDIVCFDCEGGDDQVIDHVGIYLGSDYFIHASAAADNVIVTNMGSGFYDDAFCWGRRVIQ